MKRFALSAKRILAFALALAVILSVAVGTVTYTAAAYVETTGTVKVSDYLTVRAGPGTSYQALGRVYNGDSLTIIGEENSAEGKLWYQIRYGDGVGYVHSSYVTKDAVYTEDASFEELIAAFPESYKDDLRKIHAQYPNWVFKPVFTNTEWADALTAECALGLNLVSGTSISSWKSTQPGAYDWTTSTWKNDFDSGNWVQASQELIAYYLDPRNYLDSTYVFTFLDFSYDESQTKEGLAAVVNGTFMAGTFTESGNTYNYVDVILDAGKQTGMNPYVIATIMRNELGVNGSDSISGTVPGYEGYYNYYNIGAYAANGLTAIQRGLWYAKGSGIGSTTYNRPWNSRCKAIVGGADFYAKNYVTVGQNTAYFKKFNVIGCDKYPAYTHQYMTNVQGASSEGRTLAKAYDESARTQTLIFQIPVFNNMPETACAKPTGDGSPNNKLSSLSVESYAFTPGFNTDILSYDVVVEKTARQITITATALDSTASISGTGTFELQPGVNTFEVVVTAQNGQTRIYEINVDGIPVTEDPGVSDPSAPVFQTQLSVSHSAKTISGVPGVPYTAEQLITALGVTNGSAQVVDAGGNAITGNVGTGAIIKLTNAAGEAAGEYTLIIYGDLNGDGDIGGIDLLRLHKHILSITQLSGASVLAADINRDGTINGLDLLRLHKHILGMQTIAQ